MRKIGKRLVVIIIIVIVIAAAAGVIVLSLPPALEGIPHAVQPAEPFNDNPLKGFVPFSISYSDFPHSLEFFYIPMSAFYPDPKSTPETPPDFTELEKELDKIATRGNQAIFRIYIDYPADDPIARPVGIPAFLRNEPYNLDTHDYGTFGNYISRIPDYSNPYLRAAIQNCIKALGARYDGDSRIGFITAGFLGFWGEWHCWPFNGVNNPVDYEPSIDVFNEVTTAYENAFKKTKVLFRYPIGINTEKAQFGYHDDSYCYETVPVVKGGDSFNFGEKLKLAAPSVENRWQTAPIGGELRPEVQKTIFASEPWTGAPDKPNENWGVNLGIIHPTWMINEAIKQYKDNVRENAAKASNQMGYEFRVSTAYFRDSVKSNQKLYLGVDIQNIGVAPFYYDHTTWPVQVGVKKDGKLVLCYTTTWDINTVPADGNPVRFEWTAQTKNNLKDGYYTICIKVRNPLEKGNPLGFANAYQYDDGWLDLGTFAVGKVEGISTPASKPLPVHKVKERPASEIAAASDPNTYEAEAATNTIGGSAKIEDGSMYSGGQKVGYVGNDDGTLQINGFKAPADGEYTLQIYYATKEDRSSYLSVNGGEPVRIDFNPGITWTQMLVCDIKVPLKAGENILLFSNKIGWAPDFDKIVLKQP